MSVATTRPRRATRAVRTRVPPHQFERDPDMSPEPYVPMWNRGRPARYYCAKCRLPGEPGDARHPLDALPVPPPEQLEAWRQHDLEVLGEREDDHDDRG